MAKVIGPLMSMDASGAFAYTMAYANGYVHRLVDRSSGGFSDTRGAHMLKLGAGTPFIFPEFPAIVRTQAGFFGYRRSWSRQLEKT
jgi:hypothetical protein